MTRAEVGELVLTSVVTAAIVLLAFTALRLAFPDPPIRGSFCPGTLSQQGLTECLRSWHDSHAERETHREATALGVILIGMLGVLAAERSQLLPRVRTALALAMGAGFFLPWAANWGANSSTATYLAVVGLFALAAVLPLDRPRWRHLATAAALGAAACVTAVVIHFAFFYAAP